MGYLLRSTLSCSLCHFTNDAVCLHSSTEIPPSAYRHVSSLPAFHSSYQPCSSCTLSREESKAKLSPPTLCPSLPPETLPVDPLLPCFLLCPNPHNSS